MLWLPTDRYAAGSLATATDYSGQSNSLAQGTTAGVVGTTYSPNGLPTLDLIGANAYTKAAAVTGATGWTLFCVYATAIGAATQCLYAVGTAGNGYLAPVVIGNTDSGAIPYGGGNQTTGKPVAGAQSFGTNSGRANPSWEIRTISCASGGVWSIRVNGKALTVSPNNVAPGAPGAETWLGASAAGFGWLGCVAEVAQYSQLRQADEIQAFENYLAQKWGLNTPLIVFEGNSLVYGTGVTQSNQSFPDQTAALLGLLNNQWVNNGINGQTTPQMTSNSQRISGSCLSALRPVNLVVGWEISNDIALNSATAAQAEANYTTWASTVRGYGGLPVAVTCLDRGDVANFWATANPVNIWLRANWAAIGCVALIDIAANATIGGQGAWSNTTYYSTDKIHLNQAGNAIAAQVAQPILQGLIS
ncbi:MAG: SGNH/GDSL hydrolase family protein [Patescibacteria group bacterium]|nr:SGNH/GDSL hydrolase family protein [Patescibacteria group bacterium]